MGRIIVNNLSKLDDAFVLSLCIDVIKDGRVSNDNKQYTYCTIFTTNLGDKVLVSTDLNKSSDKFTITDCG